MEPVPANGMVHIRLQADPEQPWRGVSPLASAALAGRLSAETVMALADEASGPRGFLLPTPVDGGDPTVAALKADIRALRGKVALVESTSSGWAADGSQQRPKGDWGAKTTRCGTRCAADRASGPCKPGSLCGLWYSAFSCHRLRRNRPARGLPALASLNDHAVGQDRERGAFKQV